MSSPDFEYLLSAASLGLVDAQFNLGLMYYKGQGVPQDYEEALRWFKEAAEQGDAQAQYCLGLMYHKGQGVSQDYEEALRWYKEAAEQGDAQALNTTLAIFITTARVYLRTMKKLLSGTKKQQSRGMLRLNTTLALYPSVSM